MPDDLGKQQSKESHFCQNKNGLYFPNSNVNGASELFPELFETFVQKKEDHFQSNGISGVVNSPKFRKQNNAKFGLNQITKPKR